MFRKCFFSLKQQVPRINTNAWAQHSSVAAFEPPYLESMKPKFPTYEAVTIQIKGYDFPVLENFQSFAHSVAEFLEMTVDTTWAHPARHYLVHKFKHKTAVTEDTYKLLMYERNLKVLNATAYKLPLLIELLENAIPEGATLKVFPYSEEHEKERYVPDHDLNAKKKELDELGGPIIDEQENPFFAPAITKK